MAEKQTSKDRMREIVDSIENGIKELFESDKYRKYLATMSRFHRYSVNNTIGFTPPRYSAFQVSNHSPRVILHGAVYVPAAIEEVAVWSF